jgi:hypothetical protein
VDFAPGDGAEMDPNIVSQISTAKNGTMLVPMVISSGAVLDPLVEAMEHNVKVSWSLRLDGDESGC